jgi:ankyrin repeat protein
VPTVYLSSSLPFFALRKFIQILTRLICKQNADRPLHVSAARGHLPVVRLLADKGADLNSKGMYGNTALIKASYYGKYPVVKFLQLRGADLEAKNDDGLTALILAAQDNKLDVVKYLIERGAEIEAKSNVR